MAYNGLTIGVETERISSAANTFHAGKDVCRLNTWSWRKAEKAARHLMSIRDGGILHDIAVIAHVGLRCLSFLNPEVIEQAIILSIL